MKLSAKHASPENLKCHCAIVGVYQGKNLSGLAKTLDQITNGLIKKRLNNKDFIGKKSQIVTLYDPPGLPCQCLVLVGFGKKAKLEPKDYRKVCHTIASLIRNKNYSNVALWLSDLQVKGIDEALKTRHLVETLYYKDYQAGELKSKNKSAPIASKIHLCTAQKELQKQIQLGMNIGAAIGAGVQFARRLGDLPGNICTPSYLASQARKLQRSHKLKVSVLDEAQMKKLGMGSLLSVSRGSRQPAKLIIMEHKGGKRGEAPIALVGKGLTFDAGGISIKPAASMDEMKYDMCGGASVFGAMIAAANMQLPINVVGVVPSSENLPDGNANKPGDIVTSMSGQTIEILNTDAEGRLILCDALTYTARYKPSAVIDIATLTGACIIALGHHASGLMSNNQRLADQILAAGQTSLDYAWQLPLWDEYQSSLNSNFADMANIGGRAAGTITAGCFLSRYTEDFKWAHLDIAGTAWSSSNPKGATGRVVPLLTQFLMDRSTKRR